MTKHKREQQQNKIRFYLLIASLLMLVTTFLSGYAIGALTLHNDWTIARTAIVGQSGMDSIMTESAILRPTRLYSSAASNQTQVVYIQETQTAIEFIQKTLTPENQLND